MKSHTQDFGVAGTRANRAFRAPRAWIALAALSLGLAVQAQTLRWASQGDALTMDPQSQNEGLNNAINGQAYERLSDGGEALYYYEKVAKRDPRFREVGKRITALREKLGDGAGKPRSSDA